MGWKFYPAGSRGPDSRALWSYDDNHGGNGGATVIKGKREGNCGSCEWWASVRGNWYTTGFHVTGTSDSFIEAHLEILRAIAKHRSEFAMRAEQDAFNFERDNAELLAQKKAKKEKKK